jgi:hypothetical protein
LIGETAVGAVTLSVDPSAAAESVVVCAVALGELGAGCRLHAIAHAKSVRTPTNTRVPDVIRFPRFCIGENGVLRYFLWKIVAVGRIVYRKSRPMIDLPFEPVRRRTAVWLLCAVAACVLAARGGAVAKKRSVYAPFSTRAAGFRLGTAAAPFGSATAVADFNHDGHADYAVVDRIVSRGPLQHYAVQISVSNGIDQRFVLSTPHEAVTVVVEDIDHDNDLDVVVTPPLTHDVVAVWVNDGFGKFTPVLRSPPMRLPTSGLVSARSAVASRPPILVSDRALPGWRASARLPGVDSTNDAITNLPVRVDRIRALARIDSRGPPSLFLL